jgi:hypothetical protein
LQAVLLGEFADGGDALRALFGGTLGRCRNERRLVSCTGCGSGSEWKSGLSCWKLATVSADFTSFCSAASFKSLPDATPTFCPMTARTRTVTLVSATFWWIVLAAKRVKLLVVAENQHFRLIRAGKRQHAVGDGLKFFFSLHVMPP